MLESCANSNGGFAEERTRHRRAGFHFSTDAPGGPHELSLPVRRRRFISEVLGKMYKTGMTLGSLLIHLVVLTRIRCSNLVA
jgi:hypothetical protein